MQDAGVQRDIVAETSEKMAELLSILQKQREQQPPLADLVEQYGEAIPEADFETMQSSIELGWSIAACFRYNNGSDETDAILLENRRHWLELIAGNQRTILQCYGISPDVKELLF